MVKIKIPVPTEARTPPDKVGDLIPTDAFYTAGYGCVAGKSTPMGPKMTYRFRGADLGLDYDVLVRTANGFANFQYSADKIVGENTQRRSTLAGEKEFIIYELKSLPKDIQAMIFRAMKVDWESEGLVARMIQAG